MPELERAAGTRLRELGAGRRGLQRRRRLGVPGLGRPRHARARARRRGHRGVAVAGRRRARRLRGPGRRVGPAVGEVPPTRWPTRPTAQRRRPLLPLQGRADGRRWRPLRRRRAARRWCSASTSTTSATTGPASGRGRARAPLPAGRRRLHQGRRARRCRGARPAHVGQAGGRLPGVAASPTARRSRWRCSAAVERAEAGAAPARVRRRCGCATTATWPASRCRVDELDRGARRGGPRSSTPCAPPATATSPSTSRACAPATSTPPSLINCRELSTERVQRGSVAGQLTPLRSLTT